jgi:hypothetical protein
MTLLNKSLLSAAALVAVLPAQADVMLHVWNESKRPWRLVFDQSLVKITLTQPLNGWIDHDHGDLKAGWPLIVQARSWLLLTMPDSAFPGGHVRFRVLDGNGSNPYSLLFDYHRPGTSSEGGEARPAAVHLLQAKAADAGADPEGPEMVHVFADATAIWLNHDSYQYLPAEPTRADLVAFFAEPDLEKRLPASGRHHEVKATPPFAVAFGGGAGIAMERKVPASTPSAGAGAGSAMEQEVSASTPSAGALPDKEARPGFPVGPATRETGDVYQGAGDRASALEEAQVAGCPPSTVKAPELGREPAQGLPQGLPHGAARADGGLSQAKAICSDMAQPAEEYFALKAFSRSHRPWFLKVIQSPGKVTMAMPVDKGVFHAEVALQVPMEPVIVPKGFLFLTWAESAFPEDSARFELLDGKRENPHRLLIELRRPGKSSEGGRMRPADLYLLQAKSVGAGSGSGEPEVVHLFADATKFWINQDSYQALPEKPTQADLVAFFAVPDIGAMRRVVGRYSVEQELPLPAAAGVGEPQQRGLKRPRPDDKDPRDPEGDGEPPLKRQNCGIADGLGLGGQAGQ